jgi:hypothetical protein
VKLLDALIQEGRDDAGRPWWRRTTGGLLTGIVFVAIAGQVLVALIAE